MSFAIMRTQKLKSAVAVRASLKHSFRDQETPNADSTLTQNNVVLQGANNTNEAMRDFRGKLPEKIRKNGVQCVELLITASHDVMVGKSRADQLAYFQDSLDWIGERFGGKENIINAGVHYDERTPHMYVYVVPIDENGKLNCRKFMGGTKHVMSEMQDSFADKVGKKHGLARGLKGSKAKHQTVAEYYKKLNASSEGVIFTAEDVQAQRPSLFTKENNHGIAQRLNQKLDGVMTRAREYDRVSGAYKFAVAKANESTEVAEKITEKYNKVLGRLQPNQVAELTQKADQMRTDNDREYEKQEKENKRRDMERLKERVASRKWFNR